MVVQSERTAEYLEERIAEMWRGSMKLYLEGMTESEFVQMKESLIKRKREKPKNQGQELSLRLSLALFRRRRFLMKVEARTDVM